MPVGGPHFRDPILRSTPSPNPSAAEFRTFQTKCRGIFAPVRLRRSRIIDVRHTPLSGYSATAKSLISLRSEEHTSELQSLMRISYAVFCLKKKKHNKTLNHKKNIR